MCDIIVVHYKTMIIQVKCVSRFIDQNVSLPVHPGESRKGNFAEDLSKN